MHSFYTGEYRDAMHTMYNLKYSVPKKIHMSFYNGSNCDHHFIVNDLSE